MLPFLKNDAILRRRLSKPPLYVLVAQTCVDEGRFKEQVLFVQQQGPSYRLKCPLEPAQPPSQLSWLKDCQQLNTQEGKAYLEFASLSLEDQGNYTCRQQGNNTASFTVHLIVKGKYYFQM